MVRLIYRVKFLWKFRKQAFPELKLRTIFPWTVIRFPTYFPANSHETLRPLFFSSGSVFRNPSAISSGLAAEINGSGMG